MIGLSILIIWLMIGLVTAMFAVIYYREISIKKYLTIIVFGYDKTSLNYYDKTKTGGGVIVG